MDNRKLLFILVILLAIGLRFYKLGSIPSGIHPDEESHGYNAYSLIETGKDRYGQSFPILFRSFGSYQPPLYTYLSILPVKIFGNTIFSARFVSAISGISLVMITYLFSIQIFKNKYKTTLALLSALIVAISPWAIFYNRLTAEGSLGVTVFTLSILLFICSLKKKIIFPIACLVLGLSTHAYYSERIISLLFLPVFIYLYKDTLLKYNRRVVFVGVVVFILTLVPHLFIVFTGALTRRLDQVGSVNDGFLLIEIMKKYITYFSPKNLFFDTGDSLGRLSTDMGVFYSLFIIPFILGVRYFSKYILFDYLKIFLLLIIITPISATLTGDSFYPLRVLDFIWCFSLIISAGVYSIYELFPKKVTLFLLLLIGFMSLVSFYISYFVLFKYERAKNYGYSYIALIQKLKEYPDYKIIIDSSREYGVGLRIAYLNKFSPSDLQRQLKNQLKTPYYSSDINQYENYQIKNIETHILNWSEACQEKTILVGDLLSISDLQAQQHDLQPAFDVKDKIGKIALRAYFTNPTREKCSL